MSARTLYALAADGLLVLHFLFVLFVVFSLVFVLAGKPLGWQWVRNPWFRAAHLLAIAIVVLQSWLGLICPLTIWEMDLRALAGDAVYETPFIIHWVDRLLYYQAPLWVFALCYTLFGALVVLSWWLVPPRPFRR
ncbi:MAG: DUF2784 domain-containing protein [Halioglobus sp.]|nr:DUF2784 domain-containing protein [Halioglobus sp.]